MCSFKFDGYFQIWHHIVQHEAGNQPADKIKIPFRAKQVYYHWNIVSGTQWKLDKDPLASARKFIERNGETHSLSILSIAEPQGTKVLAFEVTDFVHL